MDEEQVITAEQLNRIQERLAQLDAIERNTWTTQYVNEYGVAIVEEHSIVNGVEVINRVY